ncbi:MAG: alpha/beta hydrolase [Clostridiales bacterium]|nr:alpha/beta hydrolase [Clostridiales bacterium]
MGPIIKENFHCMREGMTICGLYFHLAGMRLPIAIVSHGFMSNYRTTMRYAEWFAAHGYAAFCFDFNGGGVVCSSDKDTTKMTVFTEEKDLKAVIAYAKSLPETEETSATLMGCSQGSVVSGLVAADLPEQVERLILFYPALCIPDDARAGKMMLARFDPDNIPETFQCGPMKRGRDYAASVQDLDLIGETSSYPGEVLIVHGTADTVVNYHYSEQAQRAYPKATLKLLPDGQHGFSEAHAQVALGYVEQLIGRR